MKWKLDENFGTRPAHLFRSAGRLDAFIREQRCLLTLDMDFDDALRFAPQLTFCGCSQRSLLPASFGWWRQAASGCVITRAS